MQKGQAVLVEAAVEGWQFTSIFAEECYKELGAGNVVVHYLDLANLKVAAQYRPDEDVRRVEEWETAPCTRCTWTRAPATSAWRA